jgi:RelA/SpoT family (p)ppGpp synthetase
MRRLVDTLQTYLPQDQIDAVNRAYEFGAAAHEGQTRKTGEPYISHPVAVAQSLAEMYLDSEAVMAAILHDTVEDTDATLEQIEENFGSEVALLVDGVSKLDQIQFRSRAEAQAESFRKMMLAMIGDIRVILVKLADRLHNMQTLDAMPASKRKRIARETLDIYAPIANRLGINRFKVELEDLGFRNLYPLRYRVLDRALKRSKGNQRQIVKRISDELVKTLQAEGIDGQVIGREKHLYSIYKKMAEKKRMLSDIVERQHLLPGTGPGTRPVQAGPRPLQGLHRHPPHQRLPVAAYDTVRAEGPAARGADSNPADGPRGRVRRCISLAVQSGRQG